MTLVLLALACADPAPAPGPVRDTAADPEPAEDTAPVGDTAEQTLPGGDRPSTEPTWTAAEAAAAITAAVAQGLPDPRDERDIYLSMLAQGDSECPGHATYLDDSHLYGCRTLDGWFYSGISDWLESDDTVDGVRTTTWEVNGDFLLRDPDGNALEVGGHARAARTEAAYGGVALWLEHSGTWLRQGHESWLATGASGRFSQTAATAGGDRTLAVEGAVGFGGTWLAFDGLVLSDGACAWGGTGAVRVRDPSGGWHTLDLGDTCGTCGPVTYDGRQDLGEACVDLAPIPVALDDAWEAR